MVVGELWARIQSPVVRVKIDRERRRKVLSFLQQYEVIAHYVVAACHLSGRRYRRSTSWARQVVTNVTRKPRGGGCATLTTKFRLGVDQNVVVLFTGNRIKAMRDELKEVSYAAFA